MWRSIYHNNFPRVFNFKYFLFNFPEVSSSSSSPVAAAAVGLNHFRVIWRHYNHYNHFCCCCRWFLNTANATLLLLLLCCCGLWPEPTHWDFIQLPTNSFHWTLSIAVHSLIAEYNIHCKVVTAKKDCFYGSNIILP